MPTFSHIEIIVSTTLPDSSAGNDILLTLSSISAICFPMYIIPSSSSYDRSEESIKAIKSSYFFSDFGDFTFTPYKINDDELLLLTNPCLTFIIHFSLHKMFGQ